MEYAWDFGGVAGDLIIAAADAEVVGAFTDHLYCREHRLEEQRWVMRYNGDDDTPYCYHHQDIDTARHWGNFVILRHADGRYTVYAHLRRAFVTTGRVKRGQAIGEMGTTGYSNGVHLHFQFTGGSHSGKATVYFITDEKTGAYDTRRESIQQPNNSIAGGFIDYPGDGVPTYGRVVHSLNGKGSGREDMGAVELPWKPYPVEIQALNLGADAMSAGLQVDGAGATYYAINLALPSTIEVRAVQTGTVIHAGPPPDNLGWSHFTGDVVIVEHSNGLRSVYSGLSSLSGEIRGSPMITTRGQAIELVGQKIGEAGPGYLHFTMYGPPPDDREELLVGKPILVAPFVGNDHVGLIAEAKTWYPDDIRPGVQLITRDPQAASLQFDLSPGPVAGSSAQKVFGLRGGCAARGATISRMTAPRAHP